jgi:nickel-dependent lactate racemase
MAAIDLKCGRDAISIEYDPSRATVLAEPNGARALSDVQIGERLDDPIGTPRLDDIVAPGERVLLVVPDATRQAAAGQIVNLLVRRLIANGTAPHEISIIFAIGIHRKVTDEEKAAILTPFIAQRIKMIDHDARDLMQVVRVGETSGGIPVELNRALTEHDHVVLVGGVAFHYFAGFTGGRKLICPGLASSRTVTGTHKLAFDCENRSRRDGVGTGLLDGNPVHEAFVEAASMIKASFAINTIVNDAGEAVDLYCGDWIKSHRVACDAFGRDHTIEIEGKRDLVIASCGGWPYDINMIQAHKALEAASHACRDGGTIVLLADCADGLGRRDFIDWFSTADSAALAERLCEKYQVNGQTAWSLLRKAERFNVRIVTSIDDQLCVQMRMRRIEQTDVDGQIRRGEGYLIPHGAKIRIVDQSSKV